MSFDRFLLDVESRDLSQADKILIRVSFFPKLSDGQQKLFFCLSKLVLVLLMFQRVFLNFPLLALSLMYNLYFLKSNLQLSLTPYSNI